MKKSLWVLLALSALIAMFVIAGCTPKTTPTPTPTPTPTAAPTAAPDTKCPEVVSTQIVKGYSMFNWDVSYGESWYNNPSLFQVVITFNENIDPILSSCIYNLSNWTVKLKNEGRVNKEDNAGVEAVKIDGKRIILLATNTESDLIKPVEFKYKTVEGAIYSDSTPVEHEVPDGNLEINIDEYSFPGLICSKADAQLYADIVNGLKWYDPDYDLVKLADWIEPDTFLATTTPLFTPPTVADVVSWKLDSSCVVGDELGNYCCGFSGEACCLEPVCTTCEEACPFETAGGTCQTCTSVCQ